MERTTTHQSKAMAGLDDDASRGDRKSGNDVIKTARLANDRAALPAAIGEAADRHRQFYVVVNAEVLERRVLAVLLNPPEKHKKGARFSDKPPGIHIRSAKTAES